MSMSTYLVKLRYYPGDPLEDIREEYLKALGEKYNLAIDYEKIDNRQEQEGLLMENTMDKTLEEITQEVITVTGSEEGNFSEGLKELYKKYRCPRTVYSLLGSNAAGEKIAKGLMDLYGGW
jgi:hypothetical protein